ncbi:hypothetical protein AB4Z38_09580 [Arthrobacter sp. 2RAF6]|uniref:hypothetical protein n=1 Tax=Arthrobacter sp. 2RAF6 TaxID=3233002 RepID=UPI003F90B17A
MNRTNERGELAAGFTTFQQQTTVLLCIIIETGLGERMFDQLPLDGEGRSYYPKETGSRWDRAEVLVVVKAAPQPSAAYGDTVCVAGIRMRDTGPEWIRLYPIPFRSMEEYLKFTKYDLITVQVKPAMKDPRSESYIPDRSTIQAIMHLKPWKPRHRYVSPLSSQWTMCGILGAQREGREFPSLAVVRPREVRDFKLTLHQGWTPEQMQKLKVNLGQEDLFGDAPKVELLEAPRFEGKYSYFCEDVNCRGHFQGLLDWELVALERRLKHLDDSTAMSEIRKKFFTEMCAPDRRPLFFVGNQLKHPLAFSVIGVYRSQSPN